MTRWPIYCSGPLLGEIAGQMVDVNDHPMPAFVALDVERPHALMPYVFQRHRLDRFVRSGLHPIACRPALVSTNRVTLEVRLKVEVAMLKLVIGRGAHGRKYPLVRVVEPAPKQLRLT